MIAIIAFFSILPITSFPSFSARGDRTLYLYYTHTKETKKITFRKNGRYDKKGLNALNVMLRDWRRNEPTRMDPALFDLVWEVYQESGATGPIHVVSAYRSPKTNEMLRSKSRAVAKASRHTKGQALDFFIPGVKISKLRQIAMKKQVGGVGYYPTSNSPFVHLDTGSVRAWPRMTTAQLKRLFPDGKTLHIPNTGVPISNKGYQYAMAQWKKCNAVPCSSRSTPRTNIRVASTGGNSSTSKKKTTNNGNPSNLFDLFFGNNENSSNENIKVTNISSAASSVPARTSRTSAPIKAPNPHIRPQNIIQTAVIIPEIAPSPFSRPKILVDNQPINSANDAIQIATANDNSIPAPRILLSRLNDDKLNPQISAYAPVNIATPNAQQAVKDLINNNIENENSNISLDKITTASVSNSLNDSFAAISRNLIDNSFSAVINSNNPKLDSAKLKSKALNFDQRKFNLIMPDLYHIAEIFIDPRAMNSKRYAVIFEHDVADFNPALELGKFGQKMSFEKNQNSNLQTNQFTSSLPLIIASK